ncbi:MULTISPECIES: hypothetical protein [Methylorubrum]|uniref:Uncharacterized protein n=1 Tax=Methylorubrum suomiense TaxID=144191 RepID=A0ABQ4UW03_9HYPH|nr:MULTISPECIES: hypothetical protein [Methylobacteriaceae]GJE75579.1 hypothetical protein BGCPKDLD_2164 [Methylorubrum suomiense]
MTHPPLLETPRAAPQSRLRRHHVLMLILAAEILVAGAANAARYRPPGIPVQETITPGHVIT